MRDWLDGLEPRERRLVLAGGLLLGLLLGYALVADPLLSAYGERASRVEQQRAELVWMQQTTARIQQLQAAGGAQGAGLGDRSLLAVVDGSAREAGLGNVLRRVRPDGALAVRVWFEGVPFDALVEWLGRLDREFQVQVKLITLERQPEAGRVHAQLTLEAAG
ncbi:MAG: type II secretion system protein M [Xanthomonadaceae bacterium]|nr:type II secretion system protein M [Xanthomonadaceae bacterium]